MIITPITPIAFFSIIPHPKTVSTASPKIFPTTGIKFDTAAFVVLAVIPSTVLLRLPSTEANPTNIVSTIPNIHTIDELKNLDIIWSSSYTRAKATAKYIANVNNLPFNLDNDLSERKLGNLKELGEFMKDKSTRDPSQEQLLDRTFRTSDGESAEQTRERMNEFFDRILKEYDGKRIAVVSHGGAIKFFLLNWCTVNENVELVYNKNTILNIKSPCLLKMTFRKNELINLEQID